MKRESLTDPNGVLRWSDNGRKVRKDKGTNKPHPPHCAHCESVREYHRVRDSQIQAREVPGGDESIRPITFKEWLVSLRLERGYFETEYGMAA